MERSKILLSDADWQFIGAGPNNQLPQIDSTAFSSASWQSVRLPHVFQTRQNFSGVTKAWYRRDIQVSANSTGKRLYLVFEGAATVADVYVNGKHLGQHRGAYTRFVFDATDALHAGGNNHLAVLIDNDHKNCPDCLPDGDRLYKVWGGLYRKVWLVETASLHIDPTDYGAPGIYFTPANITETAADLSIKVLLRNDGMSAQHAGVRATVMDPSGVAVTTLTGSADVQPNQRATLDIHGSVLHPKLWGPGSRNLYHVSVDVLRGGIVVDTVTEPLGFRTLTFAQDGRVTLNGKPVILYGANLHQEIEAKASAMSDDDFLADYAFIQDLGFNFIRLCHYPHAAFEYDLCDERGILCWAENGHTNKDMVGPTANQITTEMVKQNYNHPSIAVWSVGNEAGQEVAESLVPVVKAIDVNRPVAVANMKCNNVDFHGANPYPGWYDKNEVWKFNAKGFVTETGGGGVTTIHCDYAGVSHIVNSYEPEEYQQLLAEARFQQAVKENTGMLGMFAWWCLRDFNDVKYKKPIGWNTKGLVSYAGDRKDVYYLYRCFLRPDEPTVHITSKRYFLRAGAVNNGIKAYANSARLTLLQNGKSVSTLENGAYTQSNGHRVDHVFYWPVPLCTGKNTFQVRDDAGHTDSAVVYFYGTGGAPENRDAHPLLDGLTSSNPGNQARYMDMEVQPQWPIYYDLDSTADNSFDTLPEAIKGSTWIAMRRLTKQGQESGISFKVTRPATVFVMASKSDHSPSFVANAGFQEIPSTGLLWRNNELLLVPAQLFSRKAVPGQVITLSAADRDQIVLLKE